MYHLPFYIPYMFMYMYNMNQFEINNSFNHSTVNQNFCFAA